MLQDTCGKDTDTLWTSESNEHALLWLDEISTRTKLTKWMKVIRGSQRILSPQSQNFSGIINVIVFHFTSHYPYLQSWCGAVVVAAECLPSLGPSPFWTSLSSVWSDWASLLWVSVLQNQWPLVLHLPISGSDQSNLHGHALVCKIRICIPSLLFQLARKHVLYLPLIAWGGPQWRPSVLFALQCTFSCNQNRSNVRDFSRPLLAYPTEILLCVQRTLLDFSSVDISYGLTRFEECISSTDTKAYSYLKWGQFYVDAITG